MEAMRSRGRGAKAAVIADYLRSGCVGANEGMLGFELEHFVVDKKTHAHVPYHSDPLTGRPGVGEVLKGLTPYFDKSHIEHRNDGTNSLIALERHKANITLEPGAQLEISIGPSSSIKELEDMYLLFRSQIDPLLDAMGYKLLERGYHPTACAFEIPLIPKDRYAYMDHYLAQTGRHGICMMRASAATQVSVDFTDEADAVCKFRVASALGPLFSFITDNAPVFEGLRVDAGAPGKARSGLEIPRRMVRMASWDDCDPKRCLVLPQTFDDDFGFEAYAQHLLESPAIFTYDAGPAHQTIYQGFKSFEEALADGRMDEATIEHVLSLFFFDVRMKRYIEIRQADSLPMPYSLAFVALVKGIFYNQDALAHYAERFAYADAAAIAFAKTALRAQGYDATVYQRAAAEWLDEMFELAHQGLDGQESRYLDPLRLLADTRTTLTDMAANGR
jgi:glutamate--cysteine ligase